MNKVSVILLQWNNAEYTIACLKSLEKIDYPNFEVVIVDNNSDSSQVRAVRDAFLFNKNEGLAGERIFEVFQSEKRRNWFLVVANGNYGFSGGNNIGIKISLARDADYVLLLNNDTEVAQDFLDKLVEAGKRDKNIGMLAPKIYYYSDKNTLWFAGGRIDYIPPFGRHVGLGEEDKGQYDKADFQESGFLSGCAILVKRKVIEKIGFMPEDYFLYFEDVDWSFTARKAGYKIGIVPAARIWHKVKRPARELEDTASYKVDTPLYVVYTYRNMLLYLQRHGNLPQKFLTYLWLIFFSLKQAVKLLIPSKRIYALSFFKGIKMYFAGEFGKIK